MERILGGILIFIIGFIFGAGLMLNKWEVSAERGGFEVGGKIYRATPIDSL